MLAAEEANIATVANAKENIFFILYLPPRKIFMKSIVMIIINDTNQLN